MYKKRGVASVIIPALVIIAVVIFVILLATGSLGGKKETPEKTVAAADAGEQALVDIHAGSAIRMTYRGRINADQVHNSYQILIKPSSKEMTVYQGYLGTPIATKTYPNNFEAYTEFSYALHRLGVMSGNEFDGKNNDVRGICPSGRLTTFETLNDGKTVKELWRTSCSKDKESFTAAYKPVEKLFREQIVDFKKLIREAKARF